MKRATGFTLLEVMVAVLILGLALTAIFSGEAGAIRTASRARSYETAAVLARCKMAEIEERVAEEGLPAVEAADEDGCCEHAEVEGFRCTWRVERIVLPELDELADPAVGEPGAGEEASSPSLEQILAGEATAGPGGLASLAFAHAFPVLKPEIEERVRRATVTVRWQEGERERSFDVVQYLVGEGPSPPPSVPGAAPGGGS
ncbi:MAG: type II secretion system GspH family protein [Myxococcota bacterium]|nr:type II secretion system GspH family protein [Myxococcota bacterium]MDW8360820.1 type II secretion system protein [Myxococcales bacterium]